METKTSQASQLWFSGQKHKALRIFKTFRMNLTKEERDTLITTFEMHNDLENKGCSMYTKFGYCIDELWEKTEKIVEQKLIPNG